MTAKPFSEKVLDIDPAKETDRIVEAIRDQVFGRLHKKGAVVGLSGGIDSSVTCGLLARALGPDRVLALLMPEGESAGDTLRLSRRAAAVFDVSVALEDVTMVLEATGCYRRRDAAIRRVMPEYGPLYRATLAHSDVLDHDGMLTYSLLVADPEGNRARHRLTSEAFLEIVAATSFKQRVRKMMEYHHADRLGYAVAGTPNRLEYDQGFFVKNGDGAADLKPIAHLYKTQVYRLAEHLGVPEEIRSRPPTTDTYPLEASQDEFFFPLPYREMDLTMWGRDHRVDPAEVARVIGKTEAQVRRVYRHIDQRRVGTRALHLAALTVEPVLGELPARDGEARRAAGPVPVEPIRGRPRP